MLNNFKRSIERKLDTLKKTGFFYIVISEMFSQMITFIGGIILIRILSKADYGFYSYVNNATIMLFILGDIGASYAYFQFSHENIYDSHKIDAFWSYGLKMSTVGGALAFLIIISSPIYYPYVLNGASEVTVLMCLIPLFVNTNALLKSNLRVYLLNKSYAVQNLVYTIESYLFLLGGALLFGAKGALFSRYFYEAFILIFLLIINRKILHPDCRKALLNKEEKKAFISYGLSLKGNDIIAKIMTIIDVFMIGLVFKDSNIIASYKVAAIIPTSLVFVPNSVMLYCMPYFVKNNTNYKWMANRTKWLVLTMTAVCGMISILGILTSKWFLSFVFGHSYSDSRACYHILLINFIVSGGIQLPLGNVMSAMKMIKPKTVILIIGGISNVILDVWFINTYGSVGAAIATLSITFFSSIVYCWIVLKNIYM